MTESVLGGLQRERERWILWFPVAVGAGVALYFSLPVEPPFWLGGLLLGAAVVLGVSLRHHPALLRIMWVLGAVALGLTSIQVRSIVMSAPVLDRSSGIIAFEGRIVDIEPQETGTRIILNHLRLPRLRWDGPTPKQVRVHFRQDVIGVHPGQWVALRANLQPPPLPVAPGAYDFSRQAWFKGLGAVGFAIGDPEVVSEPENTEWFERCGIQLADLRHKLTARITEVITVAGMDAGTAATAAALITAERGPVPPDVLQDYRDAGLAHILVIAGMHMSMVAGLVFLLIRGVLAAIPPIALRYPIKKWTAVAALVVTAGYLMISGAPVPTQRAFIMNFIVLLAVLVDREAISLRSVSWAALAVLLIEPEALIGASFQMSFAAVYALIAAYEALGPKMGEWRRGARQWWRGPTLYVAGILLTTQVAGSATAFYTIFHFNRYATYSLLGNFLAVPVVGFWVMPSALLAFCLMPFGFDAVGWQAMGWGITLITRIAHWVAGLPGAAINLPSMPMSALIVFSLGGLWLCLWRGKIRGWGGIGLAVGIALYAVHRPPDILVDATGKVGLRSGDGGLSLSWTRGGKRLRETWARQAGFGTASGTWEQLSADQLRCDSLGCVYREKGHVVAFAQTPQALLDDCLKADLVVVATPVKLVCPSARLFIDGRALHSLGTHAIWLEEGGYRVQTVADWQGDRPWSRHPFLRHYKPKAATTVVENNADTQPEKDDQGPSLDDSNTGAADRPDAPEQ